MKLLIAVKSVNSFLKLHTLKLLLLFLIILIYKNPLFPGQALYLTGKVIYNSKVYFGFQPGISSPAVLLNSKGGLGNQLFQYACAYSLARRHNWPLYVYSPFTGTTGTGIRRPFGLKYFKINATLINYLVPFEGSISIGDGEILSGSYPQNKNLQVDGYCQSEEFFRPFKEEIISQFTLTIPTDPIQSQIDLIRNSSPSVAVHIRRGDFIHEVKHRALRLSYYIDSMKKIKKRLREEPTFFIFSDDITFLKDHLRNFSNLHFISEGGFLPEWREQNYLKDFYLIQLCQHQIIGSSSYGWWGAYLNTNPEKIVIAAKFSEKFLNNVLSKESERNLYKNLYYPLDWKSVEASYYD